MDAQPGPDELRIRHFLRALGARPFGHHTEPAMTDQPIIPTRIIPAGQPLPAPAGPQPPPCPPVPPPKQPPAWWSGPGPSGPPPLPPPPVDVHVHLDVRLPDSHLPALVDPEPGPAWYQRIRIAYTAMCCVLAMPLVGPWSWVLASVRDEESLAGAWVMALIPLTVLAFADNIYRVAAAGAADDLWLPKIRALMARVLLCAAAIATVLTLPASTLIYAITGVRP